MRVVAGNKAYFRKIAGFAAALLLTGCGEYVLDSKDRSEQLIEGQRLRYFAEDAKAEALLKQSYASSDPLVKAESAFQLAELAESREQYDEALRQMKKAFDAGYTGSPVRLAKAYLNASPALRNYDIAEKILLQHQHESMDAALTLAKLYVEKGKYSKAVSSIQLAETMYKAESAYLYSIDPAASAMQFARVYRDLHYAKANIPSALPKAMHWYKIAQTHGERQEAPVELAKLLLFEAPRGSAPYEEAVSILQTAAAQRNPVAMEKLGQLYYEAGDNEKALHWFTRREQLGDPDGSQAFNVAKVYKRVREVPGNAPHMQAWFEKAIAKGNAEAKESWRAYLIQEQEKEIVRQEKERQKEIRAAQKEEMRRFFTMSPEVESAFTPLVEESNKYAAYKRLKQLADQGDSLHAMLMVDSQQERKGTPAYHSVYQKVEARKIYKAVMENEGYLGDGHEEQIARQWELAARYGSGDAAYQLAQYHRNSQPKVADEWMKKASDRGSGKAMLYFARQAAVDGKGERADQEMFNWYQKAATVGEAEGQYQTAVMYSQGKGVAKNAQKARYWFQEAKKNGYHLASDVINMAD